VANSFDPALRARPPDDETNYRANARAESHVLDAGPGLPINHHGKRSTKGRAATNFDAHVHRCPRQRSQPAARTERRLFLRNRITHDWLSSAMGRCIHKD
jgi:hypothetical protein